MCRALLDLPIYSQGAVHPSLSLPPPSPHPLLDDNFDPIGRVRVASVSGRSIRSTGVGLVIGEESSLEEEEGEEDGASTGEGVYPLQPYTLTPTLHTLSHTPSHTHHSLPQLQFRVPHSSGHTTVPKVR